MSSGFLELPLEEVFEFLKHFFSSLVVDDKLDEGPFSGGEHHQTHDAFSVHLLVVFFHQHLTFVFVGDSYDHRRRPGVNTQLVFDLEGPFERLRRAHGRFR